jgi:hypothetical protein
LRYDPQATEWKTGSWVLSLTGSWRGFAIQLKKNCTVIAPRNLAELVMN